MGRLGRWEKSWGENNYSNNTPYDKTIARSPLLSLTSKLDMDNPSDRVACCHTQYSSQSHHVEPYIPYSFHFSTLDSREANYILVQPCPFQTHDKKEEKSLRNFYLFHREGSSIKNTTKG